MSIRIFYDEVSSKYRSWKKLEKTLNEIIAQDSRKPGNLNIVVTSDESLRAINVKFLEHDYFTDVITFDYSDGNLVSGEIYVSIDTVRLNAENYNVSLNEELARVIIHGILHLTGYDDRNNDDKLKMKDAEDYWLERLAEK